MHIYFSDFFQVSPKLLDSFGAFNISLINDLPLFIDPFLLFNSRQSKYQELHNQILKYVTFLRDKSASLYLDDGLMRAWYTFPEVKQTWLGFSLVGNQGLGLRGDFAAALHKNLHTVFSDFGDERITRSSHLEKLCLIKEGIGRDRISDFTTNLIKEHLLQYTQDFATRHIRPDYLKQVTVRRVRFNYDTESWEDDTFTLPWFIGDYVLLTPKDILTQDDTWINRQDLFDNIQDIPYSISDQQLRALLSNYLAKVLTKDKDRKLTIEERNRALDALIQEYPVILDHYIRRKEDAGDEATNVSEQKVALAEEQFIHSVKELANLLRDNTDFYSRHANTYEDSMARIHYLKDVIENKDGYRAFFAQGKPITKEVILQVMFLLTWFATESDVNREVNNGRGPVDFKISRGRKDSTVIEFKLAKSTSLRKNLQSQLSIYAKASDSQQSIMVIIIFSLSEEARVRNILAELKLTNIPNIVLIDARNDNKPSASKA